MRLLVFDFNKYDEEHNGVVTTARVITLHEQSSTRVPN